MANRNVDVHRIDPADLTRPGVLRLSGHSDDEPVRFTLRDENRETLSPSIVSVFWWHPEQPEGWEQSESRVILESLLYGLEDVMWVNHPHKALAARPGPSQLRLASTLGFSTPPALYTNDPEEAARFANEHGGRVVCKTLTGHPDRFIPARVVDAQEIRESGDSIRQAVHCFQMPVEKRHDVRLTVIGERAFPCKIDASGGIDWRAIPEEGTAFEATPMSRPLGKRVGALMQSMGLEYAALDFAVDTRGVWWFLEANPSGQFGFVEAKTGMAISRAIADHLTEAALATRSFTPGGGHRASSPAAPWPGGEVES
ncbi:hypothetical protein [Streptomyces sp. Tu6071]|uniref:hypothetical protein n=1 Tax=Streptomyces sp. Tu6071 TaxID=355249 RepID=UPI001319FCF1|nr:hypothetical protein [Streptomyces sp. Tu6071]